MPKTFPINLSKEEMNSLIEASVDDDFYYTLFTLAKLTGRRLGEYYAIKVSDIDFEKNLMVTLILKRKRRVEKEAVINNTLVHLLKRYIQREALKLDDYLFRKVSYRQIQYKIKHYARKAGIKKNVSFHNFRHYFITELVRKGWSHDKIAKLTGHSSVSTLMNYDHAVASDIKEDAIEAMKDL